MTEPHLALAKHHTESVLHYVLRLIPSYSSSTQATYSRCASLSVLHGRLKTFL